ncbi:hypothetical protein ScPMuIL_018521 [Solemya velum]
MAVVLNHTVLMVLSLAAVVLADGGTRTCRRRYRGCIKSGKPTEECKTLMFTCFVKYCISHSRRTTNRAKEFGVKLVGCYTRYSVPLIISARNKDFDTDNTVVDICNKYLNLPITVDDIERSHILGKYTPDKNQIICRFRSHKTKMKVFLAKKMLKDNPLKMFMSEDLTKSNHAIIQELLTKKKNKQITSFWTIDTKIFMKKTEDEKPIHTTNIEMLARVK